MLAITVTTMLEISERTRQVSMRPLLPNVVGFSVMILIFCSTLAPCPGSVLSLGSMVTRHSGRRTEP